MLMIILRMFLIACFCCWHWWPSHVWHWMGNLIIDPISLLIVSIQIERNAIGSSFISLNLHGHIHWVRYLRRRKYWVRVAESRVRITKWSEILRLVHSVLWSFLLFLPTLTSRLVISIVRSSLSIYHGSFEGMKSLLQFSIFRNEMAFIRYSLLLNQFCQFCLLLT